jgi:peptidoglycan lytic transglycosylase
VSRLPALLLLVPLLLLAGCIRKAPPPPVHFVVGPPYQAGGVWRYPEANFDDDATGIASVESGPHGSYTADGERYSADGFAAASPTLQLPAIARITNLENGRQIVVRINDRGPENPGRVIAVTRRVAGLLGFAADGTARVRVQVLPGPSQEIAMALPGGPELAIARAPIGAVAVSALPPVGGGQAAPAPAETPAAPRPAAAAPATFPADEQPGALSQVPPSPGTIWVRTGLFTGQQYAALQAAALARFAPAMVPRYGGGSLQVEVRIGPFGSVAAADSVLNEVLHAGATGAALVVE